MAANPQQLRAPHNNPAELGCYVAQVSRRVRETTKRHSGQIHPPVSQRTLEDWWLCSTKVPLVTQQLVPYLQQTGVDFHQKTRDAKHQTEQKISSSSECPKEAWVAFPRDTQGPNQPNYLADVRATVASDALNSGQSSASCVSSFA